MEDVKRQQTLVTKKHSMSKPKKGRLLQNEENFSDSIQTAPTVAEEKENQSQVLDSQIIEQDSQEICSSPEVQIVSQEVKNPEEIDGNQCIHDLKRLNPIKRSQEVMAKHICFNNDEGCGYHTHRRTEKEPETEDIPCYNTPWGNISLTEYDMPRQQLMAKRFVERLSFHNNFPIHYCIREFKEHHTSILTPIVKKLSFHFVMYILGSPKNFSYRCMTLCDMETLRQMIVKISDLVECKCSNTGVGIDVRDFADEKYYYYDKHYASLEDERVAVFLDEHKINARCSKCSRCFCIDCRHYDARK